MRKLLAAVLFVFTILSIPVLSHADVSDEERKTFLLFWEESDLVQSATRNEKPLSQVAENMTIITAKDILNMQAHTVSDVLASVPGVQLDFTPGPGTPAAVHIQGSEPRQVRIMLDGVTLNNLSDNVADISIIPVTNIDRIEIIKGPASSAWGSSSGGIINIITKAPAKDTQAMLASSYGGNNTSNNNASLSGTKGNLGYYFGIDHIKTDGFDTNFGAQINNLYGKLTYNLNNTDIRLSLLNNNGDRGFGEDPDHTMTFNNHYTTTIAALNIVSRLSYNLFLNVFANHKRATFDTTVSTIGDGSELLNSSFQDDVTSIGTTATLLLDGSDTLVGGVEYTASKLKSNTILGGDQRRDETGIYVNYTKVIDKLTVTPGIRFDSTSSNSSFISPSLGATYALSRDSLLRALISRGFSIPSLTATFGTTLFFVPNPNLHMEKVMSYQLGFETHELSKYLFIKTTLFRHDVSDAITAIQNNDGSFTEVNKAQERRQGIEVEVKTSPILNTSLVAGYTYMNITDPSTGNKVSSPKNTFDFGALYQTDKTSAYLRGHYIQWSLDNTFDPHYLKNSRTVFDASANKTLFKTNSYKTDVFISIYNIFNTAQYIQEGQKNPGRWVEGGVRVTFF